MKDLTFSLKKNPFAQYPSFQSKTGASAISTVYARHAVKNPTSALSIHPWAPSKKLSILPRMSLRFRSAFIRCASAIPSCTQSVEVNWSYQTLSSRKKYPSRNDDCRLLSEVNAVINRCPSEPARLWFLECRKLPAQQVRLAMFRTNVEQTHPDYCVF